MRTTTTFNHDGVAADLALFQNAGHILPAMFHVHLVRFREDELSDVIIEGRRRDFHIAKATF
jgi:hypothetical protein